MHQQMFKKVKIDDCFSWQFPCFFMLLHAKPELAAGGTNTTQMEVIQDFCVQIKFVPEFEEHLDNAQLSKTDIFLAPHDYELLPLSQEIDPIPTIWRVILVKICANFFTHATNLCL